jgi:hypothetical protein
MDNILAKYRVNATGVNFVNEAGMQYKSPSGFMTKSNYYH